MFPAYGAQTVHMPFGDVYTALQTGIVAMAENGINVYQSNKHYEVSADHVMLPFEACVNVVWVSDKVCGTASTTSRRSGSRARPTRSARSSRPRR